jgi:hypothetical protein
MKRKLKREKDGTEGIVGKKCVHRITKRKKKREEDGTEGRVRRRSVYTD